MTTVRFRPGDEQTWGINFMRLIRRKNESVFWAPIPKAYGLTRVSLASSMTGLRSLSQGVDLRIKPFVVAGARGDRVSGSLDGSGIGDVGLDVKYGLTSGMNLDLTLNTDFAQVEVDQQQVNLTRFSLFFPEKREFFLENASLFNVGTRVQGQRVADLFFSRRIGLSASGQPVPIIGGARMTGKVGRHNIAVMDLQTDAAFGLQGENFLVTRYSRDVLSRSKIGGIFINKQTADGRDFNRTLAVDANLALGNSFTVNSFFAKTSSPNIRSDDMAFYGRVGWLDQSWNLFAEYTDIQDNFNVEVGFVPRTGIRRAQVHIGPTPRPKQFGIRTLLPMLNLTYTIDQTNRLVTRRMHYMVGFMMEDGSFINAVYNRRLEVLDVPFQISPDVVIPVGSYKLRPGHVLLQHRPIAQGLPALHIRSSNLLRWDSDRFEFGARSARDEPILVGAAISAQRRRLPGGAFIVNLGILQLDYALSSSATIRSLVQYNSSTSDLSTSVRFNLRYSPGSDLYIAYDELRDDLDRQMFTQNRQLVVKMTYLLSR